MAVISFDLLVQQLHKETESTAENIRLLVIDDEAGMREMLAAALEELAGTIDQAGTLEEARALLRLHPHVALVDKNLPGGASGMDLIDTTKRPRTEFIMLTAFPTLATAAEAMERGAYSYLPKPVESIGQVQQRVRVAMARAEEHRYKERLIEALTEGYREVYERQVSFHIANAEIADQLHRNEIDNRSALGRLHRILGEVRKALDKQQDSLSLLVPADATTEPSGEGVAALRGELASCFHALDRADALIEQERRRPPADKSRPTGG